MIDCDLSLDLELTEQIEDDDETLPYGGKTGTTQSRLKLTKE